MTNLPNDERDTERLLEAAEEYYSQFGEVACVAVEPWDNSWKILIIWEPDQDVSASVVEFSGFPVEFSFGQFAAV